MIAFRLVWRMFLGRAAACLAAGVVVYVATDTIESGKALARLGAGAADVAAAAALVAPRAAMHLLPAVALLAAFLTAGALRRSGELEALRALGRGPAFLAGPLLAGAASCGALAWAVAELVVPPAIAALEARRASVGWYGAGGYGGAEPGAIVAGGDGTVWHVARVAPDGSAAASASGFALDDAGAPSARYEARGLRWEADGWRAASADVRALGPRPPRLGGADALRALGPAEALLPAPREPDALGSGALAARAAALAARGRPTPRLDVERLGRAALFPIALAGALLALPYAFGARRAASRGGGATGGRGGRGAGAAEALGAALAAAAILWLLVAAGRALASAGVVPAAAGTFVPPLAGIGLAFAAVFVPQQRRRGSASTAGARSAIQ